MNIELCVVDVRGKGVLCRTASDTAEFWLPRGSHVEWSAPPCPGASVTAILPAWLARRHRQLVGDVEFERARGANNGKANAMNDKPDDAGKGFLSRNERREKETHPEFTGKLNLHGTEYRLAAWVREKDGRKYFSISAREVGEQPAAKPSAKGGGFDRKIDDTIPF